MRQKKLAWAGVATLVILAAAYLTAPAASVAFLLAAAALCPIEKWQSLLREKLQLSGVLKTAGIAVLFVLGVVLTQTAGPEKPAEETPVTSVIVETVAEDLPENGTEPASEESATEQLPDDSPEPVEADTAQDPFQTDEMAAETEPVDSPDPEPESSPETETDREEQSTARDYVFNTNSKKFHIPSCSGVRRMNEENKEFFNGTREEALARGYEPCGTCKP